MALGEQAAHYPDCPTLVLVKVATGIGAGVVVDGQVYRGIDGGAGDIGHVRLHDYPDARCQCGLYGCLAAVASGLALAQRLTAAGTPTSSGAGADRADPLRATPRPCTWPGRRASWSARCSPRWSACSTRACW